MLDTQIYDLIIATPNLAEYINYFSNKNKIEILCTHIQNDELSSIPDPDKFYKVSLIKRRRVTTAGALYRISKYGAATYGNGSSSGIPIGQIRSEEGNHGKDALIATTAARDADVLVTNDARLSRRLGKLAPRCEVWSFERFEDFLVRMKNAE